MEKTKIIIGITHGDINGISYEVILKTLSDNRLTESIVPVIYGSSKVANYYRKALEIQGLNLNTINNINELNSNKINIINCIDEDIKIEPGQSTEEAGKAGFQALERATNDLNLKKIHAIVTAPINKKNIQSKEFNFPGHTEYLASKFRAQQTELMILMCDNLKIAIVTGHIPIAEVASKINPELVLEKLETLTYSLKRDFKIIRPRIAVLGLNPHAGDEGVIGNEDIELIKPAIDAANSKGMVCTGPYPADGFFGSGAYHKFDAVLAMYHDQGLIPFKTLAMENGVNYTAGLSVIRTSPAHGTAYDLAGKNIASEDSFRHAIYTACDIYDNRLWYDDINKNPLKIEQKYASGGRIE